MKRSAFTLVELIFTIVIIGVLAAVAVPKFKDLKQNAQLGNIGKYYSDIRDSAKSSYLNETELNAVTDVNLSDLYDFQGKGWSRTNQDTYVYTVTIGGRNQTFEVAYNNAGKITMTTTLAKGTTGIGDIERKLTAKTGMTFKSDRNITVLDLTAQ